MDLDKRIARAEDTYVHLRLQVEFSRSPFAQMVFVKRLERIEAKLARLWAIKKDRDSVD